MPIIQLCLCCHPKWVFYIDSLSEASTVPSKTHFRFGCPYGSSVGDILAIYECIALLGSMHDHIHVYGYVLYRSYAHIPYYGSIFGENIFLG